MVSLEDEMKQKDKEAAVLKANHKYEMLLNIELERIEKCKRTYENFHNFDVAVMKDRHNRILQKQYDLKAQKKQESQRNRPQSTMRANEPYLSSNTKTNREGILDRAGNIHDRTDVTKSLKQPKNVEYASMPVSSERDGRLNSQRIQYVNTAQHANNVRTRSNKVPGMRHSDKPNSERDYFHGSAQIINSSSFEDEVKFPILQSVSPPSRTTANSATTTSTLQRHTHFPENLTETYIIHSHDFPTPSTVSRKKKKSHRTTNSDHLSPFDQYRLRLQESEQRTRKPKHHHARAISAMESSSGRNLDDTLTAVRRARSADMQ